MSTVLEVGNVLVPVLLCVLIGYGLPNRAFLSPMMLNNVGNIGLPVTALAFDDLEHFPTG